MISKDENVAEYLIKNKENLKVLLDNDSIMVFNKKYEYPVDCPENDPFTESIDILPEDLLEEFIKMNGIEVDYV